MCLVALAHGVFSEMPLVIAANRDEYFTRPSAPAAWWSHDGVEIFGGRDLEKGGTWLGITRAGRIAVLTNVRDPKAVVAGKSSRGFLVRDALVSAAIPPSIDRTAFPAFNLLVGEGSEFFSLRDDAVDVPIARGIHGLSNHRLDTAWPKVERARSIFTRETPPDVEEMFRMLADDRRAGDDELPKTGVPIEVERALSSPFVRIPNAAYGTRSSTVVTRDARGKITFEERTWNEDGERGHTVKMAC